MKEKVDAIEKEISEILNKRRFVERGLQTACRGYAQEPMRVCLDEVAAGIIILEELDKALDTAREKRDDCSRDERMQKEAEKRFWGLSEEGKK